ncbi:MAG: hypothetical protein KQ78_01726 [Candidatus Izimaplasma bacterium HR2]|nr:MAG: hypothetical protein KQ78_01726 [Candidatus Izimaplasma bacterium HR2]
MGQKRIKKILRIQLFIYFLKLFKFIVVGALLLYWGMNSQAIGYVVLTIYLFLVGAMYTQSNKDKNIYVEIYKMNSISKEKTLNLVNSNIKHLKHLINTNNNSNFNSTITQEQYRMGTSRSIAGGSSKATSRYAEIQFESLSDYQKKKYLRHVNKNLKLLNQLQELLEASAKPQDAWDI